MATFVRTQQIEHPIGPNGRFALRVTSPDIELRASDDGTARVSVQFELRASTDAEADELFDRVRFHVREGDGFLEVTEPKRGDQGIGGIARMLGIGSARAEASVSAEVPAGTNLTYDGVSADVTAGGLRGDQEYRTVSGDLVLDRLAGTVRVRGVSSDVSIRTDDPLRLEVNTVSGDVSAFAPRFDDLRMVTVSGDVEIEGQLAEGQQHRIETVSGDLSLGVVGGMILEVRGLSTDVDISVPHRSEGSRDRRRYVVGDGAASVLFSSMSGDVSARGSRRFAAPIAPTPPAPPRAPAPPVAPSAPQVGADEQLEILRALERGEIDVDEATRRLAGSGSTDA
ncbi:MAG TPA: DUF4097 family beta strand repeat-containing protein [Candidatus Limnocylindria bacterium]|nr:DUF4097 family beta strand repeat-containing protein [Candidatus Limnocylindria bacterium]